MSFLTAMQKRKLARENSKPYMDVKFALADADGNSTEVDSYGRPLAQYILDELKAGKYTVKCQYSQSKDKRYSWRRKLVRGKMQSVDTCVGFTWTKRWRYTISW